MARPEARRHRAPGPLLQLLEVRAYAEAASTVALLPLWPLAPHGDGHPVLVLPGLAASDASTILLRSFLSCRGYAATPWGQGWNFGLRPRVVSRARETLLGLAKRHERKVSLVGWSLGGILARELAKEVPEVVRTVITLGTPFTGHPRATNAFRLYEWMTGHRVGAPEIHEPLREAPPVPTTSIYSRTDGVVSWRCSVQAPRPFTENIEVVASHFGLGSHPAVLYAIADRLALAEGNWKPFDRDGWRRLAYAPPP